MAEEAIWGAMLTISHVGTCMLHQRDAGTHGQSHRHCEQAVTGAVASALGAIQLPTFLTGLSPVLQPDYEALRREEKLQGSKPSAREQVETSEPGLPSHRCGHGHGDG